MIFSARHKMLIDFSLCQVITGSVICWAHNCCKSSKIIQFQQFTARETAAAQALERLQLPAPKSPHFFTRRRSLVRVQQSPPKPHFFGSEVFLFRAKERHRVFLGKKQKEGTEKPFPLFSSDSGCLGHADEKLDSPRSQRRNYSVRTTEVYERRDAKSR